MSDEIALKCPVTFVIITFEFQSPLKTSSLRAKVNSPFLWSALLSLVSHWLYKRHTIAEEIGECKHWQRTAQRCQTHLCDWAQPCAIE